MKYTAYKIRIGQKVLNLQKLKYHDWSYKYGAEVFFIDNYEFRFIIEEQVNDHVTNHGDDDIFWQTRDTYITELLSVENVDHEETIILSELDKKMILKIAQEKYYKSEEI